MEPHTNMAVDLTKDTNIYLVLEKNAYQTGNFKVNQWKNCKYKYRKMPVMVGVCVMYL